MTAARSPVPAAALRHLSRPSTGAGVRQLTLHLGLIALAAAGVLASRDSWILLPAMAVLGVLLAFLFAALHEAVHRTVFAGRRANALLAWVIGLLLGLGPRHFRLYHLAHHRHTQDPTRDPELTRPRHTGRAGYLWALSGLPMWWDTLSGLVLRAAGRADAPFVPPAERPAVVREARVMLAFYGSVAAASLALGSPLALALWIGPLLLGQPALRAFLMAEHTACPQVPDMLANSRTTLTGRLVRLVSWNMSFHAEHHACPSVPFHRLPQVHRLLLGRHGRLDHGYLKVHAGFWQGFSTRPQEVPSPP